MDTSIWHPILFLLGIMAFAGANAAYLGWAERKGAGQALDPVHLDQVPQRNLGL